MKVKPQSKSKSKLRPKPTAKIRVPIWPFSYYALVYVWPTRSDMLLIRRKHYKLPAKGSVTAWTQCYVNGPKLAEVHFFKQQIGVGLLTHEAVHVAVAALNRRKFDFNRFKSVSFEESVKISMSSKLYNSDPEEQFANLMEKFVRAMVNRFHELNLYK